MRGPVYSSTRCPFLRGAVVYTPAPWRGEDFTIRPILLRVMFFRYFFPLFVAWRVAGFCPARIFPLHFPVVRVFPEGGPFRGKRFLLSWLRVVPHCGRLWRVMPLEQPRPGGCLS